MTESAIRLSLSPEEEAFVRRLMGRLKLGHKERPSEKKKLALVRLREIGAAMRRGDRAEADRLRWLYFPERMRRQQLGQVTGTLG